MTINRETYVAGTILSLILIALLAGIMLWPSKPELRTLQLLPEPKSLANFNLEGLQLSQQPDIAGSWVLVYLGFTNCPDICPLDLQIMANVMKRLRQEEMNNVKAIFVSVDPERDSLEKISKYLAYYDEKMIGVSGTHEALARTAGFFDAFYSRTVKTGGKEFLVEAGAAMPAGSGQDYTVNHSARIYVISPEGQYIGSFAPPHQADLLYDDLKELVSHF